MAKSMKILTWISAMAVVATPTIGAASQSGVISAASGNVLIARDGHLVQARPGAPLRVGDQVLTRGSSSADVVMSSGCSMKVSATSSVAVSNDCSGAATTLALRAGRGMESSNQLLGAPLFLLFLGAVAVTIGTIIVVNNGGGSPTSP